MKLGLDRRTGLNRFLTSWKSPEDPGAGEYSFKLDVNGSPQLFLSMGSKWIWRTGPWNGLGFVGVPEMLTTFIFDIRFWNTGDEVSMEFTLVNSSTFSSIKLGSDGLYQRYTLDERNHQLVAIRSAARDPCDNYGRCGLNSNCDVYTGAGFECTCLAGFEPKSQRDWSLRDGSGGCVRIQGTNTCRSGEGFIKIAGVKPPDASTARVNESLNLEGCKKECLNDCNCRACTSADVSTGGSGCLSWYGDLMDIRTLAQGGQDLFVRVDAIILGKGRQCKTLFNMSSKATRLKHYSKAKEIDENGENSELQFFDLSIVIAATNNFSFTNKLGRGGFGTVYKGLLSNGQEIAVKRLSRNSGQGVEEFKNEVTLIAKLQHKNLVKLLSCCIEEEEKMLIYEYLPNKSFDYFIFDETKRSMLTWRKRFEIIIGIARGILYLHQDSRLRIIHRDLKASNILLDIDMIPKISDFGMARLFGKNQVEGSTNRVVGTYGYMSPEYAMEGLFSIKSDVYSFGVLLLEIITGRRNSTYYHDSPSFNLVGCVWSLWREGKALDIVDPSLEKSNHANEVLRCIQIGLLCVQESAIDRPTMLTIIFMLGNNSTLPLPNQPAFVMKTCHNGANSFNVVVNSINEVTITMDAR
ncbi:G-type lectin S-receptor-like serine/threonine-protein kinase At1g11410 isoform X2 [Vitis vinifera]|uniref:G-type lectin S-receptor-like serine/threonine-protein kinase At1g11410 isoform X2 n=1 Tax=Vitis vinifera TaxID=29760 RepID=UPI0028830CB6|nr:G-type lectin S-receptor-like serine/threonine-protein kinase At1g11410 isoform X2 [Vitis vinifera]XP_059596399.1 G-type lectin S-receptor-like serine/threonine-protein kinase At1g11410 isoform X2 [Vitis vinifera]